MSAARRAWLALPALSAAVLLGCTSGARSETLLAAPLAEGFAVVQAGYLPGLAQSAAVIGLAPGTSVRLTDAEGRVLRTWPHLPGRLDPDSGLVVTMLALPPLGAGRYRLSAQGVPGATFVVAADALSRVQRSLLRAYYLQRCGVALDDPETGLKHPADHLADGVLAHPDAAGPDAGDMHADVRIAATGGWHDAGDFGKYVATTAVTAGRLVSLYLDAPARFPDGQTHIPESGNGVPDILDEVRVGLDWMLAMQRADGALYRKLSGANWPGPISPDQDTQTRYVYGVSSADTAKAAAAFALASRAWTHIDADAAARYREAATRAWAWLRTVRAPLFVDAHPGDDSGSGPYVWSTVDPEPSLLTDVDDRIWAAAELWLATGDQQYLNFVERHPEWTGRIAIFEWKNPAALGLLHLLDARGARAIPATLHSRIAHALQRAADEAYRDARGSGFGLANRRFVWGSNKMDAEQGVLLAEAARQGGDPRYLRAALAQLDFLLGVNPFGMSFVTGIGERSVRHPAHLYGRAAGETIPGLFVGGPNDAAQDHVAPRGKRLLSYVDDDRAYSVNEFAIDYNASLLALIGALERNGVGANPD
ncbi:glycoside hydrolase family 9 protein [Burkholderia sp. Bp9143]|uniref:glycoside hydrolase family 9 protein n=1 Tax=Burkholderia sp. Bp9143 TaxID=2184574 RepID=UPI001627C36B|nr:glycoside hydrolase family 9 protein [Burkholderia sp. Bp9143]